MSKGGVGRRESVVKVMGKRQSRMNMEFPLDEVRIWSISLS